MKRFTAFLLTVIITLSAFITPAFSQQRNFNIDDIIGMAENNSEGVKSVKIDKIKKEIELKQAKDGIKDIRKSESTIRFSLLFNIKFPEKHGMPKEIELVMKVPQIQSEIAVLKEQLDYEKLKSSAEAQLLYYDVLQGQYDLEFYEKRLEDSESLLKTVKSKFKIGDGKQEDVEYVENLVKNYEKELSAAITSLDRKKEKLGDIIGKDVRVGCTFEEYLPETTVTRSQLTDIINYSIANDFNLYKAVQDRKYAEKEVEEVLSIYRSKYSKYIGDIEAYIKSHEGKEIDYDEFIQMYNHTLTKIDSPWAGAYVINLLFFKIRIPKEWFKGTYSGTRYMEDQKYALFVSLVDRDKARKEEENVKKELVNNIKDSYETLKQMQKSQEEARTNLENMEKTYNTALQENKMGLTSFSSLESTRTSMYEQQKTLHEMQIEYAKALTEFDLVTSGYIRNTLIAGSGVSKDYGAGNTFADASESENQDGTAAQWYINTSSTEYNFSFGIKIPAEYDVDKYELYYNDMIIGSRTDINKNIVHLSITYADTTIMLVKLYKGETLKYLAYFDGSDYGGNLQLQKAENAVSPLESESMAIGQWSFIPYDLLRGEFSLAVNSSYDYDKYVILYNDIEIAQVNKDETFKTLQLYFSNAELLKIRIDKNGKVVRTFYLQQTENGIGNVIYKAE